VNETLVKHAEDDVHRDQGSENQQRFGGERILERRGSALETAVNRRRHAHLEFGLIDEARGLAE
jgi:hypothetical protein